MTVARTLRIIFAAGFLVLQLVSSASPPKPNCEGCVPVFYGGLNGSVCFRIPTIIRSTSTGALLAFAENRISDCGDNGKQHDLVLRRSEDLGKTWGPLINVRKGSVPCPGCPAAISNPNPVEVFLKNGTRRLLLHFDTMNNPGPSKHGLDMQMWSDDDGFTWSEASTLIFRNRDGSTFNNVGALIGPSVGIQSSDGTIYFSMCFENNHWLYWSCEDGTTWIVSDPIQGLGECSITFLVDPDDGKIIMNCRTANHARAQVIFSRDGVPIGNPIVTWPEEMIDPGCQGSIVLNGRDGALYVSNANSTVSRSHMVVRKSIDQGQHWSGGVLVNVGPSAYSQLVPVDEKNSIGLLFETADSTLSYVNVTLATQSNGRCIQDYYACENSSPQTPCCNPGSTCRWSGNGNLICEPRDGRLNKEQAVAWG